MEKKDLKVHKILHESKVSKRQRYQALVIGDSSLGGLLKYELIVTLVSWLPGALGLFLRSKLYPLLMGRVGKNVIFGQNVTLRHPHNIYIGDNVVIDDNCMLDAKGVGSAGIFIGSNVFLGRNTILSCKDGEIHLEDGVNISFNCDIHSSTQVILRKNALVAAYCYMVGGGNYQMDGVDIPFSQQEDFSEDKGIEVGENVWLGAGVKVLDGVVIGDNSVVGAGAVVNRSLPAWVVATGVPAKVLRERRRPGEKGTEVFAIKGTAVDAS
jgi:acetyltransferase-like isoleucine patch superfamily enzyme